jgi:hypothetical protein
LGKRGLISICTLGIGKSFGNISTHISRRPCEKCMLSTQTIAHET